MFKTFVSRIYTMFLKIERNTYELESFTLFLPGMLTIILFCTYILPYLGSGPLWPIVIDHHATLCKKYMWRNFFFIHNYFGFDKMCLTHMHQLGIDMQLFLATPIFVYIIWKNTKMGWFVIGGVSAVSTFIRYYSTLYYKLSHVVHFGVPISRMFDTADFSYILPSHRASIYLMGIVLAWALRKHKAGLSKKQYWWILAYTIGFATWFAPIKMSLKDYVYDAREAAIYGAIYPFTWGIAISWVIYSSESHFGGWMGAMLTWKYFRIFTKIAYGVYLIQFPVFFYYVGVTRHSGEYRSILMLPSLETVLIVVLAVGMTLTVEMPFQNLYRKWTNRQK